jgi:hypothetical protein
MDPCEVNGQSGREDTSRCHETKAPLGINLVDDETKGLKACTTSNGTQVEVQMTPEPDTPLSSPFRPSTFDELVHTK